MNIIVKTLVGRIIQLTVTPEETIADVKSKIYGKEKIPVHQQRLMFNGKALTDGEILNDCKIKNDSVLQLAVLDIPAPKPEKKPSCEIS